MKVEKALWDKDGIHHTVIKLSDAEVEELIEDLCILSDLRDEPKGSPLVRALRELKESGS